MDSSLLIVVTVVPAGTLPEYHRLNLTRNSARRIHQRNSYVFSCSPFIIHVRSNYFAHMRRSTSNVQTNGRTICLTILQSQDATLSIYKFEIHLGSGPKFYLNFFEIHTLNFFQTSHKNRPRRQLYFYRREWRDSDIVV